MKVAISLLALCMVVIVKGDGHCYDCESPDFRGFGYEPTEKCGCCPWPCCCECYESGSGGGECRKELDMAIIQDTSGSISPAEFVIAKGFLKDIAQSLGNIGLDTQRVSLTIYDTNSTIINLLDDDATASLANLEAAIDSIERGGMFTNTGEAVMKVLDYVYQAPGDRPDVPNLSLLITDGRANYLKNLLPSLGSQLQGVSETVCIGIGSFIDYDELKLFCSEENIFTEDNFSDLLSRIDDVVQIICPPKKTEQCYCCCTPEAFWAYGGAYYYRA